MTSADCTAGKQYCNMENVQPICFCQASGLADSCALYGSCKATPCTVCGDCIVNLQSLVANLTDAMNGSTIADNFGLYCSAYSLNLTASSCAAVSGVIAVNANAGRRVGALCTLLGELASQQAL